MAKIVIVDDYPDLQELFKTLLGLNNFDVRSAGSAKELNTLLQFYIPDLILLDVMLGGENGKEICMDIKEKHPTVLIILISANPKLLRNYEECKADGIIEKPFDIHMVLDKVNSLLAGKVNV
ncbi:MAG TPA: response regulator [Ferruginibacter sp.]|nr:response regulator [Ferruginibacter sp.]